MNIEDLKNIEYWDLVDILNQWKENNRKIKCSNCNNCKRMKKLGENT